MLRIDTHHHAVPADYLRKQTIAGGERFVTPALKEYEEKVLGADERILERELEIFEKLRGAVAAEALPTSDNNPAAPNSGTVFAPLFRFGVCFASDIV